MIDAIDRSTTVHDNSPTDDNAWDNNSATYYEDTMSNGGPGSTTVIMYSTHTFPSTVTVKRLAYKIYIEAASTAGASSNAAGASSVIQYYDGSWHNFTCSATMNVSASGTATDTDTVDTSTAPVAVTAVECTKVRMRLTMTGTRVCNPACSGSETGKGRMYYFDAFVDTKWHHAGIIAGGQ